MNPQKTLTCLNLCLKPKYSLEKENLLISVYNVIWNFIGSMFYKNLRRVWVRNSFCALKPFPIIERDGFLHYTDTQVEVVTTEAEVQCEIINLPSVPTCSTPLCSPVKSVGDRSDDDQKDLDYIPKTLFLLDDLLVEEVEGEEKKPNNFEEKLSR